jgi:hypothetical protein
MMQIKFHHPQPGEALFDRLRQLQQSVELPMLDRQFDWLSRQEQPGRLR